MATVLSTLVHWPPVLIYLVTAVVIAAETGSIVGLVLPAEPVLLLVGFLGYQGVLQLALVLPLMLVAGLVGDALAYRAGRRLGARVRTGRLGARVGQRRWERADRLLLRHRGRAVCVARFIAFARTLTPRLAGMSGLPYRHILPWNILGVVGQIGGTVMVGYAAGRSYATVAGVFGQATGALLGLLVMIVVLVVVARYLGRHPDPVAAAVARLASWRPLRLLLRAYRRGFGALSRRVGAGGAVAVNVLVGVLLLLAIGYALTWAVDRVVRTSGLPLVDPLIMHWVAARRTPHALDAARTTLLVLRAPLLAVLVGVTAAATTWRSRVWRSRRADLVGVLGTIGAFVPLLIIALTTGLERDPASSPPASLLRNQAAVVAASVGLLAWLVGRRFGWRVGVPAWTVALGAVAVVDVARVYVGWSWPSEAVASTLLGGLWVLVFMVAWHTRDRMRRPAPRREQVPVSAGRPDGDPGREDPVEG